MNIHPQKLRFFTTLLLRAVLTSRVSFDKAFSELVRRYHLSSNEASTLYRFLYKVVVYYYTIRFMSAYYGYKPRLSGVVEYIHAKNYNVEAILDDARSLAYTLSPALRVALLYGYPPWFIRDLYGKLPLSELENMLASLNERKRWLRVNTAKSTIENALECLERHGIRVKQHREFSDMLLVSDPYVKVGSNECVEKGVVIPQDISSYIAASLLRVVEGDLVDACSAPGVKLVQVLSSSRAKRAISVDVNEKRTRLIPKFIHTFLGHTPTVIVVLGDSKTLHYNVEKAVVLIDAPCSNSGAIYADPTVKLHLSRKTTRKLHMVQRNILENSLKYAHEVFFMTCSIHPLEGEALFDRILEKYSKSVEFVQLKSKYLNRGYSGYRCSGSVYRVYPHHISGQGFFIGVLRVRTSE